MTEDDKQFIFESLKEDAHHFGLEALTMDDINRLDEHEEIIIKSSILSMHQLKRIRYLEHLIVTIKLLLNSSVSDTLTIKRFKEVLSDIIVEEIDCNGDCNNCDMEH